MAIPDAELFPHATGPAEKIVAAHQKPAEHILYSGWFCPFVQRSWITLEEKHIEYQYKEINPYHKAPSFLALNPRGLVPTLGCPVSSGGESTENDDIKRKPLIESNIISEYLDGLPSDSPSLFSTDPYERARQKIWIDFVGSRILGAYHRLLQHTDDKPYSLSEATEDLQKQLQTWIKEADPTGPFWSGKELSMVDVTLAPWVVRMWVFEHFKGVKVVTEGKEWDRWRTWAKAVEERDSVKNTLSEQDKYMSIYQKYAEDKAQSEMAKATRAGRPVP